MSSDDVSDRLRFEQRNILRGQTVLAPRIPRSLTYDSEGQPISTIRRRSKFGAGFDRSRGSVPSVNRVGNEYDQA